MPEPVEGTFSILISVPERSRRHIISIALKIRVLSRTSLMFLWELKNAIISTKSPWTLCYRNSKTKQKNSTHGGFDKLSHRVIYYYSRCLSLLKARSYSSLWFRLRSITVLFITTLGAWACWRHILIPPCDFDSAQSPYYLLLHSVPEPVEGTFLFLPVISTPLNHRVIYY